MISRFDTAEYTMDKRECFRICLKMVQSSRCLRNLCGEKVSKKEEMRKMSKFWKVSHDELSRRAVRQLNDSFTHPLSYPIIFPIYTEYCNDWTNLTINETMYFWALAFGNLPGIIFPLNLTHESAHICPSKYDPYIFLHWAQFRKQMPRKSKSPAESIDGILMKTLNFTSKKKY